MQNKLNEILELCIEKSDKEKWTFYEFRYDPYSAEKVTIIKWYKLTRKFDGQMTLDQALEYMQNE